MTWVDVEHAMSQTPQLHRNYSTDVEHAMSQTLNHTMSCYSLNLPTWHRWHGTDCMSKARRGNTDTAAYCRFTADSAFRSTSCNNCCFTAALLLLYCCFSAAFLLLYCCLLLLLHVEARRENKVFLQAYWCQAWHRTNCVACFSSLLVLVRYLDATTCSRMHLKRIPLRY